MSAPLIALCFPCRVAPEGLGPLALLAWVPLFAVLGAVGYGRGVFYGTASWTVATMLSSSWLGTYSLVSLQLVTVVLALEGAALFAPALALIKKGYCFVSPFYQLAKPLNSLTP